VQNEKGDHGVESTAGLGRGECVEAVKWMWKVEEGGSLKTWQPGTDANIYGTIIVLRESGAGWILGGWCGWECTLEGGSKC
jgi:hypothetical protein